MPSINDANNAIKSYSESSLKGIVGYTDDPIVSSDVSGREETMVFDEKATMITRMLCSRLYVGMIMAGDFQREY